MYISIVYAELTFIDIDALMFSRVLFQVAQSEKETTKLPKLPRLISKVILGQGPDSINILI